MPDDKYNAIMNYEFMVYICEGEASEKLEWFKVVNIAGEKLTEQEIRNISYTGEWLSDAKLHFSKRNCAAKLMSDKYITGDPNRQELLEKALKGICEYQGIKEIHRIYGAAQIRCGRRRIVAVFPRCYSLGREDFSKILFGYERSGLVPSL